MLARYFRRVWYSRFARSVAVVASGTAGAQAIGIAFAPLITRLYGPEAFGVLGTFTALVGVLSPLAAMAYPIAIVLPRNDADALGLARISLIIAGFIASLIALVLILFKGPIVATLGLEAIAPYLMLVPAAMVLTTCMAIMSQWVIRKTLFRVKATVAVLQALVVNSVKAGIGFLNPVAAVLVVTTVLGSLLHALLLFFGTRAQSKGYPVGPTHRQSNSVKLASEYRDFPFYRAPQNTLNAASQSLPILMLAAFFGPASAGFYALGRTVLSLPINLIGNSVSDVFYPKANESAHAGYALTGLILKGTGALCIIGLFPFSLIALFGPWLFDIVFGSEWVQAGEYARWLSLMLFFNFINKPAVAAIPVLGLQKGLMLYELFSTGSKVVALYLGFIIFSDDYAAVALFSASGAIAYLTLIIWVLIKSHTKGLRADYATEAS